MIDLAIQYLTEPFISSLIGLIGLLVSVIGLYLAVTQAHLAAKQATRAADISQQSKAAVDAVLARIDREGALLDATTGSEALARAMRDLGKRRFEEAVGEARQAIAAIQRLLADQALENGVFSAGDTDQLRACVAEVGHVRARLVESKISSFPPEAVVQFAERLLDAERVLQRAVPIIKRSNRT